MDSNPYYDKLYREICSEKTLQSNSKGFFMDFVEHVIQYLDENWISDVFAKLKTDKERVRIVYTDDKINLAISSVLSNVQPIYRKKDAEFAKSKRLEAEAIRSQDLKKSLALYSQSVLRSPKTGENKGVDGGYSLPIALLERSQVLIKLEKYKEALADIQLSLKEGLPNLHKAKAYWKMGICFKALNDKNRADVSFNLAEKLISDEVLLQKLKSERAKSYTNKVEENKMEDPQLSKSCKEYPCASHKISVKSSKDLGRHTVANEQINTGETLVVEEPYVACLLPEKFGTHCHHCFDRLISPVGCDVCSGVAFCKIECKQAAWCYHRYECKFLHLLIGSGMSILAHSALRMITQNSFEKSLEIYHNKNKEKLYSLCTNGNLRSPDDFFQRTLMTTFLFTMLKKSGYFLTQKKDSKNISQEIPSDDELKIAEMILFNLQILQFNTHEVYETLYPHGHKFRYTKTEYIGVALYPTASLFNHDCCLAVSRHFIGKKIVIQALKPFKVNELVPENYGPVFTRRTLAERQRSLLSRYWFTCRCNACVHDWPSFTTGLDNVSTKVRCPNKKCDYFFTLPVSKDILQCPKCKTDASLKDRILLLKWCEEQYKLGFEKMDCDQQPNKAIEILSTAIDTFYKISCPPNKTTQLAEETLRICLADYGNCHEALIKKTT